MKIQIAFILVILNWTFCSVGVPASFGATYYVGMSGDDSAAGTSSATPWRTIERVNREAFKPGDHLLFEGGKTFRGNLRFDRDDTGQDTAPIVVGSYGTGRSTIDGGAGSGILIDGVTGLTVNELIVVGAGRRTGNQQGVGISLLGGRHLRVDAVEAYGFQRAGIEIRGCVDVRVTRAYAHDNGYAGISSDGERSEDLYIGHCRAINNAGDPTILNNHSGNGIALFNVSKALIEYCEAAENGWDMPRKGNGPVGIWCANHADRVTIQFCISHHNKSPDLDGGGFDFDGGVTNSVMQYNYSYKNQGWGYLLYEYGSQWPFRKNVVRYCISEDDGDAGIGIGERATQGFSDCEIYNNVISNEKGYPCVWLFEGNPKEIRFRNNVFISRGGLQVKQADRAIFQGNCYWTAEGGFAVDEYESLAAWAKATGQETLDGVVIGKNAAPRFEGLRSKMLTDPTRLGELTTYRPQDGSPLIDAGLDLTKRFGIETGSRDFLGTQTPRRSAYDIGAYERP